MDYSKCLRFTKVVNDGAAWTFRMTQEHPDAAKLLNIQWSQDEGITWKDIVFNTDIEVTGKSVIFKGSNKSLCLNGEKGIFFTGFRQISTKVYVGGNVMSLLDDGLCELMEITEPYCFYGLFMHNGLLGFKDRQSIEGLLPATKLAQACYEYMFAYTMVDIVPPLPTTKLEEFCYAHMFENCINIQNNDNSIVLPATQLAPYCYYEMFNGCYSLLNAPELPATELKEGCYSSMFYNCSSLENITVSFTQYNKSYMSWWVENVAPVGTFYNLNSAEIPTGIDGIPEGWNVKYAKEGDPVEVEIEVFNATTEITGEKKVGSTIQIKVNPFPGYRFIKWGDGNTDNPRTMLLKGDVNLTAIVEERVMEKIQYRLQGESEFRDEPLAFDFTGKGGSVDFDILYTTNQGVEYTAYCYFDWGTITDNGGTWINETQRLESYTLNIPRNNSFEPRKGEVIAELPTVRGYMKVNQSYEWSTIPCWMDYYYEGGTETLDYYVEADGIGIIYYGRAYLQPGKRSIKINISKIVQDYLKNEIDNIEDILNPDFYLGSTDAVKQFYLYKNNGTLLATYDYRYDWSYEMADLYDEVLTTPINGHRDPRMIALGTDLRDGEYYVTEWKNNLYTTGHCGDYALYYLQRNGGYAAFLIEGNATKADRYQKYSYNMAFNNTKAEFEERTYHNQISTEWTFSTGWLKDSQAENLAFNLLPSNTVYLHDLNRGKIIPVVITENEAVYKTFRNAGKQMVNYTIRMAESQKKQLL